MFSTLHRALACAGAVLCAAPVAAQFPGDLLFEPASTSVASGDEFDVALQVFVGSEGLGALTAEVAYDPAELEIVSADVAAGSYQAGVKTTVANGTLRITVVKDAHATASIGTVTLLDLHLRALAAAGTTSSATSRVIDAFDVDLGSYSSSTGFGLTVTVAPPQARSGSPATAAAAPPTWLDAWWRAGFDAPPRPIGGQAVRYLFDVWRRVVVPCLIRTRAAGAPADVVADPAERSDGAAGVKPAH